MGERDRRDAPAPGTPTDAPAPGALTDAEWALRILAADPVGIGGVRLRAEPGPARDAWLAALRDALPCGTPWLRVPSHVDDDRLLGGLDLAATLQRGQVVTQPGLLAQAHGGIVVLAMAERCEAGVAARIAQVVDTRSAPLQRGGMAAALPACVGLVALDEAGADDAAMPVALAERLGIDLRLVAERTRIDAAALDAAVLPAASPSRRVEVARARALLPRVDASDAIVTALCEAAQALGIVSMRAPSLALRVARVAAALDGRRAVLAADAALAARLVLGPRARAWPRQPAPAESDSSPAESDGSPAEDAAADPPPGDVESRPDGASDTNELPDASASDDAMGERVLDAAAVALPKALLASIAAGLAMPPTRAVAAGRSGAARRSASRGRPIASAPGALGGGARLDLLATLRAAAPWQALRRRESPAAGGRLLVRGDDFHVRRYRERRESTTVFAVDASGSQALHRLAETKGAVELLLADCYVRRDRVAVIAFRGTQATVLLAPTRSLVHARRSLAGLPGGGGTPLASGLVAARTLAGAILREGGTPLLVLLTDGSANVALDGAGGRQRAAADALAAAAGWASIGVGALLIDTAPRDHAQAQALADAMKARYVALPDADAHALASTIAHRRIGV